MVHPRRPSPRLAPVDDHGAVGREHHVVSPDVPVDERVPADEPGRALGDYPKTLNGYQWPIAMDVRRGRYLQSPERPTPLVPNQVVAWDVPLRDHDHVFKRGHRIMVQVQSSWFPLYDRNPQTYVENIFNARPEDYKKATQRIYHSSFIELPVMEAGR